MRVLYIVNRLSTGGAEKALHNLLSNGLGDAGEPAVLSLLDEGTYGPRLRDTGVHVYALGMRRGVPGPVALQRLYGVVKRVSPDLIQGWMYHGNLAATVASKLSRNRAKTVWGIRQSLYSLTNEKRLTRQVIRANRWLSGGTDAIVYNSRVSRSQHEALGFDGQGGRVIPNGFDLAGLGADRARGCSVRHVLRIPENGLVIGHVARLHPMKDHAGFVRAAVRLARADGRVHIVLAGQDVVADNEALTDLVPGELRTRFHWLGERDDVPDLLRAMDVLCLSSAWGEAFPNVLGEAMATEVPCVTTDVGDGAMVVGDTGVVVPPQNEDALAAALMQIISKSPDERRAMGRAARARVEEHYALPSVIEQYRTLYAKLVPGA